MKKKSILTKILAITGTILVWLPIFAPIFFTMLLFAAEQIFRFDFLMPAELFPSILLGSGLLIWAALRAKIYLKPISASIAVAILALFGGQFLAVITGLASGETEPTGWPWLLVIGALALYTMAVIALGICGILLLRALHRRAKSPAPPFCS